MSQIDSLAERASAEARAPSHVPTQHSALSAQRSLPILLRVRQQQPDARHVDCRYGLHLVVLALAIVIASALGDLGIYDGASIGLNFAW